ncbi:MAG: DUF488 domain-containing protein [Rudaea sp.]
MAGRSRSPRVSPENIRLKRAYAPPAPADGTRVLVDRLWPRGVSREAAALDLWMKEIAPSDALRRWFGHDPARWDEFRRRYADELGAREVLVETLRALARRGSLTLVYGARDEVHNDAVVLRDVILGATAARRRGST